MTIAWIELGGGLFLAILTLRDVFETVVVPGESRASLRVARRSIVLLLPLWKLMRGRQGISSSFAPLVLVTSFFLWMLLLTIAFAMMAHALRYSFAPPLPDFAQAIFLAGSGLVTIGLSETDALGAARWVVLASGFCGLGVMTMAVTYLLEVQSSLAARDSGLLKLRTSAGDPPSGLAMLEKYAAIDNLDGLVDVLKDGRDWCAKVLQSHAAHPSLIYFRTVRTGAGWPASLGALLDLALLVEHYCDLPALRGRAVLLREDGARMAGELAALLDLRPGEAAPEPIAHDALCRRLRAAGYRLRGEIDAGAFEALRGDLAAKVAVLADHLGKAVAPLIPRS